MSLGNVTTTWVRFAEARKELGSVGTRRRPAPGVDARVAFQAENTEAERLQARGAVPPERPVADNERGLPRETPRRGEDVTVDAPFALLRVGQIEAARPEQDHADQRLCHQLAVERAVNRAHAAAGSGGTRSRPAAGVATNSSSGARAYQRRRSARRARPAPSRGPETNASSDVQKTKSMPG